MTGRELRVYPKQTFAKCPEEFEVYGEESGYMKTFKTLKEATIFIREIKQFDKEENIQDNYYIEKVIG